MKKLLLFAVTALFCTAPLMTASAQEGPAIALHVGAKATKGADPCPLVPAACADLVTQGNVASVGEEYSVYLLAIPGADGFFGKVSGIQCGIWYETGNPGVALQVFGWFRCADLDFPGAGWPSPGGSNTITWTSPSCNAMPSDNQLEVAGYFQVSAYSPALMTVTTRSTDGRLAISKCPNGEVDLSYPADAGWLSFGGAAGTGGDTDGCNSCIENCAAVAVERTTWGKIKSQYNQGD